MYPKWKKIPLLHPHCPICGEPLSGNNSVISPYKCSCGEWESKWNIEGDGTYEFVIKEPHN